MSTNILTEYSDRVRYFLSSRTFGTIQIQDPIGWDEDEMEFSRNKENHGVFTSLSNSLSFINEAKEFVELVYTVDGINAEIILKKEVKNEITDDWEPSYTGFLDYSTKEQQNNQVSLKFNSGGIEALLKIREGDEIEIDRVDSLDGKIITPFTSENIQIDGRRIFLESTWKGAPMTYYKELSIQSSAGNTRYATNSFPFDLVVKSHEQASSLFDGMNGSDSEGSASMMLLANVDRRRKFKINIQNILFNAYSGNNSSVNWGYVAVSIVKYANGLNFTRIGNSAVDLWRREFSGTQTISIGNVEIGNSIHDFILEQGESLGLEIIIGADFDRNFNTTRRRSFNYKLHSGSITIQEDSEFNSSNCECVTAYYLANRLVEIITGRKNAVKSTILESGKWKDLLITHGFWIRGFSKDNDLELPEENRKFKPLTTCFKDFMNSLASIANIGYGVEKIGVREYVIIEDLKYFYNRNNTIKLPLRISNVKRIVDASLFYKSLEFGYEKGGEYEEAMGLDEYNVRNSYTTCIHKVDNKYTKISKYRADTYGIEFARRKPFMDYSTEDTSYDQDMFFIDAKRGERQKYIIRLWQDDFNQIPSGVFSPETAYNLRLSPFNIMLRHGWYFGNGLTKYPNQKIRYSSSQANSKLKTLYAESGEIENAALEKPRFEPEIIEFEHICTHNVLKMLVGRTTIIGTEIPNCYGLIEFINENGDLEKGYLMSVKPNGVGNWKVLKYYR